jgi:hypothetical protein
MQMQDQLITQANCGQQFAWKAGEPYFAQAF